MDVYKLWKSWLRESVKGDQRKVSLCDKAKIHIERFAWSKSFRFMFYSALHIIHRRIPLPSIIFKGDVTDIASEKYLERYMIPKHDGCFVDIGANVGLWTFFVAEKQIEVQAFEPIPRLFRILKKKAETYSNIHVYPCALGEENYTAKLDLHSASLVKKATDFSGCQIKVTVRTLDSFNIQNVGLIKIDTEGYELPILLGARQTIIRDKPRLIVEVHTPYKEQIRKIIDILKNLNYKWIIRCKEPVPQPHIIADPKERNQKSLG